MITEKRSAEVKKTNRHVCFFTPQIKSLDCIIHNTIQTGCDLKTQLQFFETITYFKCKIFWKLSSLLQYICYMTCAIFSALPIYLHPYNVIMDCLSLLLFLSAALGSLLQMDSHICYGTGFSPIPNTTLRTCVSSPSQTRNVIVNNCQNK